MDPKMEFRSEIIQPGEFTPREIQIVRCICDAMTDKQIARLLAISVHTVTNHIENIYEKLGIRQQVLNKRMAVLRLVISRGLVRVLCLVLSVSASVQSDHPFPAARVRCGRTQVSSRRFD